MNRATCVGIAAVLACAAGCNDNDLGIQKRRPNLPPETILTSGPPDSVGPGGPGRDGRGTSYRVHFYWVGTDLDGTIDHYDFILVDHPAIEDSIRSGAAHPVVVTVPQVDDPRWTSTLANDSLIVTRADTLRRPPRPRPELGETPRGVIQQSFERWHTFFIRAVDNEGMPDPTPHYRSFNSTTLAPTVRMKYPVWPGSVFGAPPVCVFNWDGQDQVGDGSVRKPIGSRWTYFPSHLTSGGEWYGWPDSLYALPDSAWRPWRPWDAADLSGVRAVLRNLLRSTEGGGYYIFAVQAMDEAGAVTPVFDYGTPGMNNAVKISVAGTVGPNLVVTDGILGTFSFGSTSVPLVLDVGTGQPVHFRWRGDASRYGGAIVAYRYGWNMRDPSNDEEWEQGWSATATSAPVKKFNSGTQRFLLETRDNAESVTRAEIELVVHQVTRSRDLLLVDDTLQPQGDADLREQVEDLRWLQVIDTLVARRPSITFDRLRDVYDVRDPLVRNSPPPLTKIFDYKTVVWLSYWGGQIPALRKLELFFDPFTAANLNKPMPFSYLSLYIQNRGQIWVCGAIPAITLWPVSADAQLPINIPGWDDPVTPHPEIDSVGTTSFLYKMGIEAFDKGGGGGVRGRLGLEHQCKGMRRAVPQGYEMQDFTSTTAVGHRHTLRVPSADVEAAPAAGVTYTASLEAEHAHTVFVSRANFRTLQRGEAVSARTSEEALPAPHTHAFNLVDQVGLWGAPPVLLTGTGWASPVSPTANPWGGRPSIEIYNMPSFMETRTPPLRPAPWRSVVLYTYVSGVPADSARGLLYPQTADGQPVFILTRATPGEAPYFSRAWCSFEPYLLNVFSHQALADFVLLRKMRLGLPHP